MDTRRNNFDFLRLIFASFVIITHSYPLSGVNECDYLCQLTNGQVNLSYVGVKGFFVISGYLIFQSLQRSHNIFDFFWKRILRVFPALFIVLLITVCLSPFVYQSDVPFFSNKSLQSYLPNNLSLYRIQFGIDGVFEKNPYKSAINGSLWTIPYEFTLYIFLSILIIFRKKKIVMQAVLLLLFSLLLIGNVFYFEHLKQFGFILSGEYLLDLGVYFIAGSLLAAINIEKINRKKVLLLLISVLVISSIYFGFYIYSRYLMLPILFILLGLNPIPYIDSIGNKIGDLSYGIYIYGFPVQQTLMYYFKLNYLELMTFSLMISFVFAYFSWHVIEKNALKLKKLRPIGIWFNGK